MTIRSQSRTVNCANDDGPPSTPPHVYRAITRVTAAFASEGIPKRRYNHQGEYHYRSIDDLTIRLARLLARHGLCILPEVLRRECDERPGSAGALLTGVRLLVRFNIVSARDGSRCTIKAWGEALDESDKGTPKAMSSAYKYAMLQLFCIPVAVEDADATSPRPMYKARLPEPDPGWSTWAADIIDMIGICETSEALERIRTRHAELLGSLRSERPDLYKDIGKAFGIRTQQLGQPSVGLETPPPANAPKPSRSGRNRPSGATTSALEQVNG